MTIINQNLKERYALIAWALILALSIIAGVLVVEWSENRRFLENQRQSVVKQIGMIRARLEGGLNMELLLARSIIIDVETNTDITEERFFKIAQHFMKESKHIRNIGLAKGTVLTYVYPIKGNEKAIGFDYKKNVQQWPAVQRVIEGGKTVVAGPLNLLQGGVGIIGRTPIFIGNGNAVSGNGREKFFGMLSVVINLPSLLEAAGLDESDSLLKISIRGKDGLGAKGECFYGSESLFENNPVLMGVSLPGGNWLMAATPVNGWVIKSPRINYYRLTSMAVGLVILSLLFIQHREVIRRKSAEKAIVEKEIFLKSLLDAIPVPVFYKDRAGIYQGFNDAYETFFGKSKNQLIGKSVFDISPNDLAQIYHDKDTELFNSGEIQTYESKVKNAKHEMLDVIFDKAVYTDNKGNVIGLIGIIRDITSLKQIEKEREKLIDELQSALVEIRTLKGIVPICSNCKKIRDDAGYWNILESYIQKHSDASFSHSICPECSDTLYGNEDWYIDMKKEK